MGKKLLVSPLWRNQGKAKHLGKDLPKAGKNHGDFIAENSAWKGQLSTAKIGMNTTEGEGHPPRCHWATGVKCRARGVRSFAFHLQSPGGCLGCATHFPATHRTEESISVSRGSKEIPTYPKDCWVSGKKETQCLRCITKYTGRTGKSQLPASIASKSEAICQFS